MTVNKFIRKLLKLKELVVCGFDLNERKRHLLIFVKPYKNGCRCGVHYSERSAEKLLKTIRISVSKIEQKQYGSFLL